MTSGPTTTKRAKKYVRRFSTRLTKEELVRFRTIKKYVVGWCGPVSDAEVLRYLVREWSREEHS